MLLLPVLSNAIALLVSCKPMTHNFHEAISSLRLSDPSASIGSSTLEPRSYESTSSVDSSYTRRGQTESDADIRGSLAAARDLATRKKRLDVHQLSSSMRPRERQDPLSLEEEEEENQSTASGSKTPLPDTSAPDLIPDIMHVLMVYTDGLGWPGEMSRCKYTPNRSNASLQAKVH